MKNENDMNENGSNVNGQTTSSGWRSRPGAPVRAQIASFRGEFGFLSNFHEATIYVDGDRYRSVEHAYQAFKTNDPWSRRLIREAGSPGEAKKLGKSVALRPDWEDVKVDLMTRFVRLKFENPFLRPLLLATGDAELIEGNTWNDTTWGVCRGVGQNWLGRILMQVRDEIKAEESGETTRAPEVG